jgi:hypothetical protein
VALYYVDILSNDMLLLYVVMFSIVILMAIYGSYFLAGDLASMSYPAAARSALTACSNFSVLPLKNY